MTKKLEAFTIDELITGLGDIQATTKGKSRDLYQAVINILRAISEEGVKTTEDALDVLYDYRLQAKQYSTLWRKHMVAGKPSLKDGVWHCPDCNRRVAPNHSFCHRCGKKLGWR